MDPKNKIARWYFGGTASALVVFVTHPLDLLKVHLQTQQKGKVSIIKTTSRIIKNKGIRAFYNGISASICRQLTYSTTRFAIYDILKQSISTSGSEPSFIVKVIIASIAGGIGGIIGSPPDMINVRMQNDMKLPPKKRRNYKHVIDGLWRVYKKEGALQLFSGCTIATTRAIFMTIGQLSFYDQIKITLIESEYFKDNLSTHFIASLIAGAVATSLTQPLDVLKTRAMNARRGDFRNTWALVLHTAKLGPLGFFKGYFPAFLRLGPHTILTFIFLEQLRLNFGYYKE